MSVQLCIGGQARGPSSELLLVVVVALGVEELKSHGPLAASRPTDEGGASDMPSRERNELEWKDLTLESLQHEAQLLENCKKAFEVRLRALQVKPPMNCGE